MSHPRRTYAGSRERCWSERRNRRWCRNGRLLWLVTRFETARELYCRISESSAIAAANDNSDSQSHISAEVFHLLHDYVNDVARIIRGFQAPRQNTQSETESAARTGHRARCQTAETYITVLWSFIRNQTPPECQCRHPQDDPQPQPTASRHRSSRSSESRNQPRA